MRSLYFALLYASCFSRLRREKKKQLKGLRPFDPDRIGNWKSQYLRPCYPDFARDGQITVPLSAVPAGSLRASTAGAQPSIHDFPLLGGGRGWAHV